MEKRLTIKLQASSFKPQRNPKTQAAKIALRGRRVGVWTLEFLWCLGFGTWSFCAGIRLLALVAPARV
jgi:hypothetical protein